MTAEGTVVSRTEEFKELRPLLFMLPPGSTRGSTEDHHSVPPAALVVRTRTVLRPPVETFEVTEFHPVTGW